MGRSCGGGSASGPNDSGNNYMSCQWKEVSCRTAVKYLLKSHDHKIFAFVEHYDRGL